MKNVLRCGGLVFNLRHFVSFEQRLEDGVLSGAYLYFSDQHKVELNAEEAQAVLSFFSARVEDSLSPSQARPNAKNPAAT